MSAPPSVDAVLRTLKAAVSKSRKNEKKRILENINQVSSHFVLLNSSTISFQASQKLASCLRRPLVSVYAAFPTPALQLAAAIFHKLYHEKVLSAIGNQEQEQKVLWEAVLNSLLSGVLDFLDQHEDSTDVKETIASALYSTLCDICFSLTAPMMSVELRCTAYSILSDSATKHGANQRRLRDQATLGGERLGSLIWRTKDYIALESLLNLFACILPSTNNSAAGRAKRTAFIQAVFVSSPPPESASAGKKVANILEHVPTSQWEETALKIIDSLAMANVSFPQPFAVNEVIASQASKPTDRLYIDDKAFVANILVGDDQYDSLNTLFSTIRRIDILRQRSNGDGEAAKAKVIVRLSSPPTLGKDLLPHNGPADPSLNFVINSSDVERLVKALQSRGLDPLLKDNALPKLSLAKSPAILEFDSHGRPVKEPSQDERIENVSQFYGTNHSSDDLSPAPALQPNGTSLLANISRSLAKIPGDSNSPVNNKIPHSKNTEDATSSRGRLELNSKTTNDSVTNTAPSKYFGENFSALERTSAGTASPGPVTALSSSAAPLARSHTKVARDAVFGASDEELSEISDADAFSAPSQPPKVVPRSASALVSRRSSTVQPLDLVKIPTRAVAARRVVDSDDEDEPYRARAARRTEGATPKRGAVKKKAVPDASELSEDETKAFPLKTKDDVVTPILKRTPPVPATPIKEYLGRPLPIYSVTSGAASDTCAPGISRSGKDVLRATKGSDTKVAPSPVGGSAGSDDLALGVSASSNERAPRDAPSGFTLAKPNDATVNTAFSGLEMALDLSLPSSPLTAKSRLTRADKIDHGAQELHDNVPYGSSSVPVVKIRRKSVKSRMRKKDQPVSEVTKTSPHVESKAAKRKRDSKNDEESWDANTGKSDTEAHVAKKPRQPDDLRPIANKAVLSGRTDSQVLRPRATAATRSTKRYRAKKDRISSPIRASMDVDYDALPSAPPAAHGRFPSSPVSVRRTEQGARKAPVRADPPPAARRTRAGAALTNKENKHAAAVALKPRAELKYTPPPKKKAAKIADEVGETEDMAKTFLEAPLPACSSPSENVTFQVSVERATDTSEGLPIKTHERVNVQVAEEFRPPSLPSSARKSNATPWASTSFLQSISASAVDPQEQLPAEIVVDEAYDIARDADAYGDMSAPDPIPVFELLPEVAQVPAKKVPSSQEVESGKTNVQVVNKPQVQTMAVLRSKNPQPTKVVTARKSASGSTPWSSPPHQIPPSQKQPVTIDLTNDSPVKVKSSPALRNSRVSSPAPSIELELDDTMSHELSQFVPFGNDASRDSISPPLIKPSRSHYSVTFAPLVKERQLSPVLSYLDHPFPSITKDVSIKTRNTLVSPNSILKKNVRVNSRNKGEDEPLFVNGDYKKRSPDIQDIADVLTEISQVILQRIEGRFEGIRGDVRAGREALFAEAAYDLFQMRAESVVHFNRLIDLEAEYAKFGRAITNGMEDMTRLNQEICGDIGRTIEDHDRNTMSKKIPASLIPAPPSNARK